MKKILILALILVSSPVWADDEDSPRLVSVTGEGEVFAVPDEVAVNFQVETFDSVLADAKKANDEAIRGALEVVQKHGVDEKDFKTDYFTVRNDERYYMDPQSGQQRSKRGFFVTKNVAVLLKDVSKFEALYSDVLEAGVNNISGVDFRSSAVKKHREAARTLAVQDAKDKATKLASELGQQVGRPYSIVENIVSEPWPRPMMMAMKMQAEDASAGNETIALGQLKIVSTVAVSFELQ